MTGDWPYLTGSPHVVHHGVVTAGNGHLLVVALVLGLVFAAGLHFGRRRGLKHLGQTEFNARWRNVRNHRRW
jgi:hypothetical protein